MKRIVLFLFFSLVLIDLAKAQQEPMYTQYMFNTLAYNPAYAGSLGFLSMNAIYRIQWV
ncbi:MAG: type IX secretion system membrane protein PorP/SprF, partial [Bacteroidota bacterium]